MTAAIHRPMLKKACCVSFRQSTDINLTCLGGADFPVDESTYIGAVKSLSNDMSESDDVSNNFNSDDSISYYRAFPNDNYLPIPIIILLLIPLLFFGFMPLMC